MAVMLGRWRNLLFLAAILGVLLIWEVITDHPSPATPHGRFADTLFSLILFWMIAGVIYLVRLTRPPRNGNPRE
jgi:hypothetical protein